MVEQLVEKVGDMIDLAELPFIDTMMTTIVFYGIDRKLHIREAKTLIEEICQLLNEMPAHAHIGTREGNKTRSPKFGMLSKSIDQGNFDEYEYIEGVNYFEKGNVRDLSFSVGIHELLAGKRISIHYKRDRVQQVDLNAVVQTVLEHTSPEYGILYNLTVREGPMWFETGIISSGMSDGLSLASSEFKHEYLFGKKFSDGFFRDVFKWNYLSKAHLDKSIYDIRFQDWIEEPLKKKRWLSKTKTRGILSLLDNGCAVWKLSEEEAAEVRPRMLMEGLLMVKS
jgi:hypothetical protein